MKKVLTTFVLAASVSGTAMAADIEVTEPKVQSKSPFSSFISGTTLQERIQVISERVRERAIKVAVEKVMPVAVTVALKAAENENIQKVILLAAEQAGQKDAVQQVITVALENKEVIRAIIHDPATAQLALMVIDNGFNMETLIDDPDLVNTLLSNKALLKVALEQVDLNAQVSPEQLAELEAYAKANPELARKALKTVNLENEDPTKFGLPAGTHLGDPDSISDEDFQNLDITHVDLNTIDFSDVDAEAFSALLEEMGYTEADVNVMLKQALQSGI